MTSEERLAELDERFVGLYEATRRRLLDEQKARARSFSSTRTACCFSTAAESRES
jgi:hypothetical protein